MFPTNSNGADRTNVVALCLVVTCITACAPAPTEQPRRDLPPPAAVSQQLSPIRVSEVQSKSIEQTVSLPISIEGYREAPLQAKLDAFVDRVLVDIGDIVGAGQLLAKLSAPELELRVAQQASKVAEIVAERDVRQAEVRAARSQLAQREATIELRESELERTQRLAERGSLTRQKLAEAQHAARAARAVLGAQRDLVVVAEARLEMAVKRLDVARAALQQAEVMTDYLEIRAPFAGKITQRDIDPGELVRPTSEQTAKPLLTVTQVDKLRGIVHVTMDMAADLNVGDETQLEVVDLPGKIFAAQVARLAGSFDPQSRMMRAEVDIDNPVVESGQHLLKPGSYGTLQVTLAQQQFPAVRPSAVKREQQQISVMVVTADNVCLETPITIAAEDNDWVSIQSGVSAGARVVADNPCQIEHEARLDPTTITFVE